MSNTTASYIGWAVGIAVFLALCLLAKHEPNPLAVFIASAAAGLLVHHWLEYSPRVARFVRWINKE